MRVVLFGVGEFLRNSINRIINYPNTEIVGLYDNDERKWNTKFCGYTVYRPDSLKDSYDYIIITCTYAADIARQLEEMLVNKDRIKRLKEYEALVSDSECKVFKGENTNGLYDKSLLIFTPVLEYTGAPFAVISAATYLSETHKYKVGLVVLKAEEEYAKIVSKRGVDVYIWPYYQYKAPFFLSWMKEYKYYLVNTLLLWNVLQQLPENNTCWWIHESALTYESEIKEWGDLYRNWFSKYSIYCVSKNAQRYFDKYIPTVNSKILEYGIRDEYHEISIKHEKCIIAIIGYISYIKGHDVFLEAFSRIGVDYRNKCEIWFIGKMISAEYICELNSKYEIKDIHFWGYVSHDELNELYKEIDVVVAPSRQDTMSIAITEGLMQKKICVVSRSAGISEYLTNGVNAFVFDTIIELESILRYVIDHKDELESLRSAGRKVFQNYFTMEKFYERFIKVKEEVDYKMIQKSKECFDG